MIRIVFLFIFCFCISTVSAATEKAYIVFSAGLNEIDDKDEGGYAELAHLLETYRKKTSPTFFIFGGGSLFPSVLSSFDHGTHIIDLLNSLEPDVMAASKGDFAFSEDELSLRTYEAAFPIVQSNSVEIATKKNIDGLLDSVIIEQGPYKFGFISLMDAIDLEAYNLMHIKIIDPRMVIENKAKELRQKGASFIILHYGGNKLNCINLLNDGLVNIVLRSNPYVSTLINEPSQQHPRQVLISDSAQAAVVELNWEKARPETLTLQWQASDLSTQPKNLQVQLQVDSYTGKLNALLNEIIGSTTTKLDLSRANLRIKENAFGNLIADLLKKHSAADIALINSGAIRGEDVFLHNNIIKRRDIIKALPYRDTVVLLEVSGEQLLSALENGFSQIESLNGRFPQLSGIKVVYNSQAEVGRRVEAVVINGRALNPSQYYKLATILFIAEGGDGYLMFKENKRLNYEQPMSELLSDIVINELRFNDSISPKVEERIVDVAKRSVEQQ